MDSISSRGVTNMKRFGWLIGIGIALIIVLAVVIGLASTYNGLVKASQEVDGQWAQVETQYQRRFDLIPNLVNSVKGAMQQEQEIFNAIAEARTKYGSAATTDEKAEAAGELESAISRLLVGMENYPELKAIQAVITLMDELAGTENRISVERGRYNTLVRDYNTRIKSFPTMLLAGMFGFSEREYFESVPGANQPPVVDFG
jgi:LemA protein